MRLFFAVLLLAASTLSAQSLSVDQWLALKERYLQQTDRPERRPNPQSAEAKVVTTEELLSALPSANQWAALADALRESIDPKEPSIEGVDNAVLLALIERLNQRDNPQAAAQALKLAQKQWEEYVEENEIEAHTSEYISGQIAGAIANVEGREVSIDDSEKQLEYFEHSLAQFEPVSREQIAEMVGGEATLKELEAYIELRQAKQKELWEEYVAKIEAIEDPTEEQRMEAFEETNKKMNAFTEEHAEQNEKLNQLFRDPNGQQFLMSKAQDEPGFEDHRPSSIRVPDLVTIVGKKRARNLLERALAYPVTLSVQEGETRDLAKEIAQAKLDELKAAQWPLVAAPEDYEFGLQMMERFPEPAESENNHDRSRDEALSNIAIGLMNNDQTAAAVDILTQIEEDSYRTALENVEGKEQYSALYAVLSDVIARNPQSPLWRHYVDSAVEADKLDELYAKVRQYSSTPGVPAEYVLRAYDWTIRQRLEDDDLEGAIKLYREAHALLEANREQPTLEFDQYATGEDLGNDCLRLGRLLNDPELIQLALDMLATSNALQRSNRDEDGYGLDYRENPLLDAYLDLKDYAALEALAQSEMEYIDQLAADFKGEDYETEHVKDNAQDEKADIFAFFLDALYEQKRYADIMTALTESPLWNDAYLSGYLGDVYHEDLDAKLAYVLHTQGQSEAAAKLLEQRLLEDDEDDQLYEVYIAVKGEDAIPFLDRLASYNRFEERPLIWKAQALLEAGKVQQAETVILEAMKMDPSDGDKGKGDRMRVYAVMGEIRAAQGNAKEAAFFDDVLRAIRLSEDADDFYRAGLKKRAIEMYKESLTYFVDAYCIQSRLAVKLMEQGREEEAIKHYTKAYELMPSSFGRIESHCFGCEGAFRGEQAQSIAEEVFSGIISREPNNPQAYYLMAYLRENQGRDAEAYEYLQKAVEIDPEYLNAWKKLGDLADEEGLLTPEQSDEIVMRILQLDPLGRNSSLYMEQVNDYKKFWPVFLEVAEVNRSLGDPQNVYRLNGVNHTDDDSSGRQRYSRRDSAGKMLMQDDAIDSLMYPLQSTGRFRESQSR